MGAEIARYSASGCTDFRVLSHQDALRQRRVAGLRCSTSHHTVSCCAKGPSAGHSRAECPVRTTPICSSRHGSSPGKPEQPISLTESAVFKTRVFLDGEWYPLAEREFRVSTPAGPDDVRISEIQYHPRQPSEAEIAAGIADGDDFDIRGERECQRPHDRLEYGSLQYPDGRRGRGGDRVRLAGGAVRELRQAPVPWWSKIWRLVRFSLRAVRSLSPANRAAAWRTPGEMLTLMVGRGDRPAVPL